MSILRLLVLSLAASVLVLRRTSAVVAQNQCAVQANTLLSGRTYINCTHLPYLDATLHYTYDPANSSLSIAYVASPTTGGAWIAWAINPTSTGMVGSQALIALKPTGGSAVVAKTFNVSSYSSIMASPLSFEVWDLAADEVNGTMLLFGSVKVPGSATSLNQVWQVGGAVDGSQPLIHPLSNGNRQSMGKLELAASAAPGPSPASGTIAMPPEAPAPAKNGERRMGGRGRGVWLGMAGAVVLGSLAF
ncbi:hypothetical protein MLD38_021724 [Melastoma candidum]|uniref:Uncharacterized protein n=1 Tax=Melastoma candidum TaxID=119954 RepID=A0ACB9QHH3_9MYRT|nr:hypothetical protein MLD38_021724 [Melastoma candidum]